MLAALAMLAVAAAPPPERLNALSFDNGALMIEEAPAYQEAAGLDAWSAWHASDGDESQGWCSPEKKPTGGAFGWDLDTTWSLTSFALSTQNLQESAYPGCSAKTVELYVGDGKAPLRKVGTFSVGVDERKEHKLPPGTAGKRVRVVVTANHGNSEFTELAEVELFGTRQGKVATPTFAGDFRSNYGPMRLTVEGEKVLGCYDWVDGAAIEGVIEGRVARVTWTEPRDSEGKDLRTGTATFAISGDAQALKGIWYEEGALRGEWVGPRTASREASCTPRKRSQLEQLRKQKRLVLYGVRFDSNSDVPRPESEATIAEVHGLLKEDPNLRLLVEGHTDSTNTDAYNLDLSQRRAQSVVAALIKRGAAAKRLEAQGFGRTRPIADNASAQGRALNRRVEVSIAGQ